MIWILTFKEAFFLFYSILGLSLFKLANLPWFICGLYFTGPMILVLTAYKNYEQK